MKAKILILITLLVCFSMIFVACDKDETTTKAEETTSVEETTTKAEETTTEEIPVCEEHKDENADAVCDACARAIVVVTQPIAPEVESRVDMIVNEIPSAELTEYVNTAIEKGKIPSSASVIDGMVSRNGVYVQVKITDEEEEFNTYKVYDVITGLVVCTDTDEYKGALGGYKTVSISMMDNYVVMTSISSTPAYYDDTDPIQSRSVKFYTYGGENFCTLDWVSTNVDEESFDEMYNVSIYNQFGLEYVQVNDDVYVIDPETKDVIHTDKDSALIYRPEMDAVVGDLGYRFIYENEMLTKIYVYDLTKWIECIYSYFVPSYYDNVSYFVLRNGNVLVQSELALPDTAVSFDYISNGIKYDLVYTMIDTKALTESEIEFGYYINDVYSAENAEMLTEKAINIAEVCPIENDRINSNNKLTLIVDNGMKVLYDCQSTVDLLTSYPIADGLFLHVISEDDYYLTEIVNEKNERVAYVPYGASLYESWIVYEDKFYDYSMKLILDPEKSEYTVYNGINNMSYMLLTKVNEATELVEYYYFNASMTAPELINGATSITYCDAYGFQISERAEQEDGSFKTVYSYYGTNNVKLFEAETYVNYISQVEENDAYIVTLNDGTRYIVK